jgi:D-glycero-D-manno-heptose 1,7-bisphosphate phosphatase
MAFDGVASVTQGIRDQVGIDPLRRRAVFLDRDGVINSAVVRNGKPYPPASVEELEILPGVAAALERLRHEGFMLIVVTNQPDVARGTQSREVVEAMHDLLNTHLTLDAILVCYHDDADRCECRKPAPGLLLEAARAYNLDLAASFMVGDRWRDIEAGRRAGCKTIFIDYQYDETMMSEPNMRVGSVSEAVEWIFVQS